METITGSRDKDGAAFFSLSVEQSSRLLSSVFSLEPRSSLLLLPAVSQHLRPSKHSDASLSRLASNSNYNSATRAGLDEKIREELRVRTNLSLRPREIVEEIRKGEREFAATTAEQLQGQTVEELIATARRKQEELAALLESLNTGSTETAVGEREGEREKKTAEDSDSPTNLDFARRQDFFGIDCDSDKLHER